MLIKFISRLLTPTPLPIAPVLLVLNIVTLGAIAQSNEAPLGTNPQRFINRLLTRSGIVELYLESLSTTSDGITLNFYWNSSFDAMLSVENVYVDNFGPVTVSGMPVATEFPLVEGKTYFSCYVPQGARILHFQEIYSMEDLNIPLREYLPSSGPQSSASGDVSTLPALDLSPRPDFSLPVLNIPLRGRNEFGSLYLQTASGTGDNVELTLYWRVSSAFPADIPVAASVDNIYVDNFEPIKTGGDVSIGSPIQLTKQRSFFTLNIPRSATVLVFQGLTLLGQGAKDLSVHLSTFIPPLPNPAVAKSPYAETTTKPRVPSEEPPASVQKKVGVPSDSKQVPNNRNSPPAMEPAQRKLSTTLRQ